MPALPCVNHPNETTFVRCGRCDQPFCVKCLVDTPVGKKCKDCSRNRTQITESSPLQVVLAFLAATVVAIPAGWLAQQLLPWFLSFIYGALVAEVTLRAGQRRRSLAMQVAAGAAAVIGALVGGGLHLPQGPLADVMPAGFYWQHMFNPWSLIVAGIGAAVAVSRVRYL